MTGQPGRPRIRRAAISLIAMCLLAAPSHAQTPASDPFINAVAAVKDKDYAHAADLFESLARTDDHDAQFNLALLLKAGQGRPQNFEAALEWAQLARLGGVQRAEQLAEELIALVPQAVQDEIAIRIDTRQQERLARGDRVAVMQYVSFNRSALSKPNLERAYLWALIGAALGIRDAATIRDEIASELNAATISQTQREALELFKERDMTELFKPQSRAGS